MDLLATFLLADRALQTTIEAIGDDGWATAAPRVFASDPEGRSVGDAVRHIARDEAWVPALLAGRTLSEVGVEAYDGDLLGPAPGPAYGTLASSARGAARERVDDLERPVHCSFGDCPLGEYLWQLVVARTLGADALAGVLGRPTPVGEELAEAVCVGLAPRASLWCEVGILFPPLPAPAGAAHRERLLALAGLAP